MTIDVKCLIRGHDWTDWILWDYAEHCDAELHDIVSTGIILARRCCRCNKFETRPEE